jgi:hypothetical protein
LWPGGDSLAVGTDNCAIGLITLVAGCELGSGISEGLLKFYKRCICWGRSVRCDKLREDATTLVTHKTTTRRKKKLNNNSRLRDRQRGRYALTTISWLNTGGKQQKAGNENGQHTKHALIAIERLRNTIPLDSRGSRLLSLLNFNIKKSHLHLY